MPLWASMVSAMGEATSDGDTTFTRTPQAPSSLASVNAIVSRAAFDALYGPLPLPAVRAASELTTTTLAPARRRPARSPRTRERSPATTARTRPAACPRPSAWWNRRPRRRSASAGDGRPPAPPQPPLPPSPTPRRRTASRSSPHPERAVPGVGMSPPPRARAWRAGPQLPCRSLRYRRSPGRAAGSRRPCRLPPAVDRSHGVRVVVVEHLGEPHLPGRNAEPNADLLRLADRVVVVTMHDHQAVREAHIHARVIDQVRVEPLRQQRPGELYRHR